MDTEESVEQSLTELEQNAMVRRQRLLEFRTQFVKKAQQQNGEKGPNDDGEAMEEPISLFFRSYKPSKKAEEAPDVPNLGGTHKELDTLEKHIPDQLEASEDTKMRDELDLKTLAPRKVDWDLRRGVQEKLDKLERRTKKAINQLIRQRVNEGAEDQLAAAVDSVGDGR
ncbi:hypothetical protein niasHS_003401 [Heterodera schachtii]|uniref:Coiled-coil domain-containing protein 12 n=1 Tax=Heterodera schachtii TaxID=97005 RepID=A0ABD2KGE2_HETSC